MSVAIYIVINCPFWINPDDFGFDFKVRSSDVRPTNEAHTGGNATYSCKRRADARDILQG